MTTAKKKELQLQRYWSQHCRPRKGKSGGGGGGRGGEEQEIEERRERTPATVCENKRR